MLLGFRLRPGGPRHILKQTKLFSPLRLQETVFPLPVLFGHLSLSLSQTIGGSLSQITDSLGVFKVLLAQSLDKD